MDASWLNKLNDQQRAAATFGNGPLLIVAGAGTGKTNTLAHRVAYLISTGIKPERILLLTFSRRAASEMLKRVETIVSNSALRTQSTALARVWGGTFHSIANRLLRLHSQSIGLGEAFTVIDRSDAEDLLNDVRSELALDKGEVRFPKKGTCLSIYSRCVNAQEPIESTLKSHFPWCSAYPDQLKTLFKSYVGASRNRTCSITTICFCTGSI